MQHRMKEFAMTEEKISGLLERALIGRISTISEDGYPYTVVVHFVWKDGNIYFHGLVKGQKLDNIKRCPKVCFEVDEFTGLLLDDLESPCKADAAYESIVIIGDATIIEGTEQKKDVFAKIIDKYLPSHNGMPIPEKMVKGTAVVEIKIDRLTGKYHE